MAQFAYANPILYSDQPHLADEYLHTARPPLPMPRTLHSDHRINLRYMTRSSRTTMALAPPALTLAQAMV